ncbi:efflux RND transporter periplasmic adaptor subunit [Mucilaginibacter glaciei]|uniref:Efflux RND transporter periplasmic adaptor subunit n=1 Tax=Mucilaginibacter glaciei TaxID=2772109 RepID=A0A926NNX3_9SPHI|nr:efflux RND transporter periplasmic adaptor subunit [Mucilaginibacter glaciei]MBD1391940.1 efflux RND transporter periplasmic adaptor subunit [Mucilaginibacter glaciei]
MNKSSAINFIKIAMLAFTLQACGPKEEKKAEVDEAPVLEVVPLKKGVLSTSVDIPGELVAYQQVDLYAKVNSFIKKLNVDIGSQVHAGDLLATMEAPEFNSQLSGAQSRLQSQEALYQSSKATYNRLLQTSKTPGTVSPNELDLALAKQNSDLAQLQSARASLREVGDNRNYLQIRAPFDGIITARNVSMGAYVGPSGKGSELPVFTLQEQKKLRLAVSVPESYTGVLNNKSEVNFTVKAFPGQNFTARVTRLSGALDARLRSQRTEMDVTNTDKKLLPGMVAEVHIPFSGADGTFIVPAKAVLNSTQGVYVIKVTGNKAHWVAVKTGRTADDKTEVFGPLTEGDQIIKIANEEIRDNSDVKTGPAKAE